MSTNRSECAFSSLTTYVSREWTCDPAILKQRPWPSSVAKFGDGYQRLALILMNVSIKWKDTRLLESIRRITK
jgi:hypothetical protein